MKSKYIRCARCGSMCSEHGRVLWNGPRGFRRYDLCPPCQNEITQAKPKSNKPKRKVIYPGGLAL